MPCAVKKEIVEAFRPALQEFIHEQVVEQMVVFLVLCVVEESVVMIQIISQERPS